MSLFVPDAIHDFVNFDVFKSLLFLRRGNSKSDNSLKRLRITLKSERTVEKTTRH